MKKTCVLSIALMGFAMSLQAQGIFKVTKKNGSESGYDHIKQTTDNDGNTLLNCEHPGYSKGEFVSPPNSSNPIDYNKVMALVETKLKEGTLKGETVINETIAKWDGKDSYNYTLTATPTAK